MASLVDITLGSEVANKYVARLAGVPSILTTNSILLSFNSVAVWSSVPLTLRLFATLKNRRGLYFRSILCASWGLTVRGIAYFVQYLAPKTPWFAPMMFSQLGWIFMVSGFAIVLWSRLGFILQDQKLKRYLLWMIVFNGVVFHTIMTIMVFVTGAFRRSGPEYAARFTQWKDVQQVFERIQIVAFCGQEILISSLYIRAAYKYLRTWGSLAARSREKIREAMIFLLLCQAIVVAIDVAIITIDFLGLIKLKGFLHSFIYCVKLEIEFVVLNQLVEIAKLGVPGLLATKRSTTDEAQMPLSSPSQAVISPWTVQTMPGMGVLSSCSYCSSTTAAASASTMSKPPKSAFQNITGFSDLEQTITPIYSASSPR